jgi:perosamine synthetase
MKIQVSSPIVYPIDFLRVGRALLTREMSGYSKQYLPKFEAEFREVSGTKFVSAVNSGTSAIYLALAALNLPKGTKVAVSSYTNMATFFPVLQLGLVPVPVDIELKNYNMSHLDLEKILDSSFGAIIVVHIFGNPAQMDHIMKIADRFNLPVIEDCAEAHGAQFQGKSVGSFGIAGCFSFYANKLIGMGEGGAISTNDENFNSKVNDLRSLGFGKINKFLHDSDGYNFRMTNIQAALGLSQIAKLNLVIQKKKDIALAYNKILEQNSALFKLPTIAKDRENVVWMYHLALICGHSKCRDHVINEMGKKRIELRPGFIPYSDQGKVLLKFKTNARITPNASKAGASTFYLPTGTKLKKHQIKLITNSLVSIVESLH